MRFVGDDKRSQILPALVRFPCVDYFLLNKTEHEQHLRVGYGVILVCKQRLKVKVNQVGIHFQRRRRVPNIRISAAYEFLQIQLRRPHIPQSQAVCFFLVIFP